MVRDTDRTRSDGEDGIVDQSRRNLVKFAGVGAGLAALGGASVLGAGQETDGEAAEDGDDEAGGQDGQDTDGGGDDGHFLDDLVDPVFGYPLARDETDDVSIEHVVDVTLEEGTGAHENFPQEPNPEAPGSIVEIPAEFFFDPVGLHVEPGDLVHFNAVNGLHTVTAFHPKFDEPDLPFPMRVPEGVPGFTSPPLTPGESWVYEFTERGVYDYFCFPHFGLGMVGRIVVFDPEEDDIESDTFAAPTAGDLFSEDERVYAAPELDPANIVEAGSVAWADLTIGQPTTPKPGTATPTETETETEVGTATATETPEETATETETDTATDTPEETATETPY